MVDARGQGVAAVPVLATGERKREAEEKRDILIPVWLDGYVKSRKFTLAAGP